MRCFAVSVEYVHVKVLNYEIYSLLPSSQCQDVENLRSSLFGLLSNGLANRSWLCKKRTRRGNVIGRLTLMKVNSFPVFVICYSAHNITASSASSSSESESISSPLGNQNGNEQQQSSTADVDDSSHSDTAETNGQEPIVAPQPKKSDPEQAFDELYLKQATKEFANDLDKLRSASDFNERSVPMLIEALRQGRACFTAEESRRIGQAGLSGGDGL